MRKGFTLVEILIVMALIGILVAIIIPNYNQSVTRAKESVLKENLFQIRDTINKYYFDKKQYPTALEDLVTHRYLKKIPVNPFTRKTDWIPVHFEPAETEDYDPELVEGIIDIKCNPATGGANASRYADW